MARGRMISKTISLDEKVNALSDDTARLLFTWLIPHLDCEGRQHGDATTIKSIVFPRRNISTRKIEKYLKEMEKLGMILRFSVNGNTYLCAPNFEKHQTGLQKKKESQSQIPPFTPELLQSKVGNSLLQVKDKDKVKVYKEINKERKNGEISKLKYGEFHNVALTEQEHQRLKHKFGDALSEKIESLSCGIESHGYKYKSHYAALLNWDRRDKQKGGNNAKDGGKSRELPTEYTPQRDYGDLPGRMGEHSISPES